MASIKTQVMEQIAPEAHKPHAKVTVVGAGQVGMAAAFSMMTQSVVSAISLVDVDEKKLQGEMMDLSHGQAFIKKVNIEASSDYAITAGSAICVVTAGARQREGESRLNLVQRNADIFKSIIPKLVHYSPDTILVIVSNPVDVLTWVAWKLSGLPRHRVIGSGTMLDSSRFRFLMGQRLNVSASSCHGYIIGEHGDSSVAVWSGVNVGGVRLRFVNPDIATEKDPEDWAQLHKDVINSAYEIIRLKGYTSWAIGLMVSTLVNCILKNQKNIYALSTCIQGFYGIDDEVCLSLPCVVGESGITNIFKLNLSDEELAKLRKSATTLNDVIQGIKL